MSQVEKLREQLSEVSGGRSGVDRQLSDAVRQLWNLAGMYRRYCARLEVAAASEALTETGKKELRAELDRAEQIGDFVGVVLLVLTEGKKKVAPTTLHRWLRAAETTSVEMLEEVVRNEALRALADEQGDEGEELPF